jgi:RNA polymerase sigma-70 factor (ECF subfamily)
MRSLLGRGRRPAGPPGTAEPSGGSPRARLLALADEELMALAAGADADAFEILHDRHAGVAFSLAYRICGDRASAEDAYQDAMLSVWRSAERYRPHLGSVRSWILTLVHHRAIDLVRRRARVDGPLVAAELAAEAPASEPGTEALAFERADRAGLRTALDGLPADQRQIVGLAYYGGFSQAEIAATLELPLGTVKSRMRLGLDKLRRSAEVAALHA